MRYHRFLEEGAGFMALPEDGDGLPISQVGEVWAPGQWSVVEHQHLGLELYFQGKGNSWWEFGGEERRVLEHGAYLVMPGTRHRLLRMSGGGVHFVWMEFALSEVAPGLLDAACWQRAYSVFDDAGDLNHGLQGVLREVSIRERFQAEVCAAYVAVLCAQVARLGERRRSQSRVVRHPAGERAMRLLAGRLGYAWRLDELARRAGVSVPHLIDVFRRDYGQTPMRVLTRLRLEEARRRLGETEVSVTEIAHALGFASSQHLARLFREAYGQTPTQVRA
ncbi:MAG: helix-turn-helix transcriptional regulator [Cephaloticoccus sp.]|nr:helix-turn-helix transcriptional regulator [Cephaloticoccus sp.]